VSRKPGNRGASQIRLAEPGSTRNDATCLRWRSTAAACAHRKTSGSPGPIQRDQTPHLQGPMIVRSARLPLALPHSSSCSFSLLVHGCASPPYLLVLLGLAGCCRWRCALALRGHGRRGGLKPLEYSLLALRRLRGISLTLEQTGA